MLLIRRAEPEDRDWIWEILEPVFEAGDTYAVSPAIGREAGLEYWMGGTHTSYLALSDDGPLGTYYICPNQMPGSGGDHVANAGFATAPRARGKGVARAMLGHAEAEARRNDFRAMQFNFVLQSNAAALRVWLSSGYQQIGRIPGAFRHPHEGLVDALILFKDLSHGE